MYSSPLLALSDHLRPGRSGGAARYPGRACTAALQRHPAGSVVELGCYIGTTSLFIRRLMNGLGATGEFHVYDSFAGPPDKSSRDHSLPESNFAQANSP